MSVPQKQCPQCKKIQPLSAAYCDGCGRQFRTTAPNAPPPDHTIMVQPPEPPPTYQHPPSPGYGYSPPQYQPRSSDFIQAPPGTHSPTAPILLAVLLTWWAGALGNRQTVKGLVILAGTVVMAFIPFLGCVGLLAIYGLGIFDTIQIANRINRGEPVGQWQFF